MQLIEDIKLRFVYIYRMLNVLHTNDKRYLIYIIINIILQSINPFIFMFLAKLSIDMLIAKSDYKEYLFKVSILLVSILAVNVLETITTYKIDVLRSMFGNKLFENIFNKTMELDYCMLLDKEVLEKQNLSRQLFEEGSFAELVESFRAIITSIIILMGTIVVVIRIDIWIIAFIVVIAIINSKSTSIRKKFERMLYLKNNDVFKKMNYFRSINSDFAYGKEIRIYNMRESLNRVYRGLAGEIYTNHKKTFLANSHSRHIQSVTSFLLEILVYAVIGFKSLVSQAITVGDFSLFLNATRTFNSALQNFVNGFIMMGMHGQYLKDYFDYMDLECNFNKGTEHISSEGELVFEFENVSFTYPHQIKPSLRNINLKINHKEKLSVVGENGAGKTTLVKLLLRLYDPTEGRVLLNGIDIKKYDYQHYLSLFSSVFQDYKIFAFKISENVASLNELDNMQMKVDKSLDNAGLREKIDTLPNGVNSYIYNVFDKDGIELSGGESQKLAIARAIFKDSPIIILDEPTAALDPRAEYEIYKRFNDLVHGKASIFITHRLSSTRFCDRVIVLKNGELVENGSHDDLMKQNGYYKELYGMQAQFYTNDNESLVERSVNNQ